MPRIVRVRFVHVGHENAQMDDLVLRLYDETGRATDSTIWLRNGGGKSSILNLLFSIILPNRHDFLGGKANQGERTIDHYVHETDPGYVIIEWELDDPAMLFDVAPRRYLTGVAYEKRAGALEDPYRLDRLFFAGRVIEEQPKLTLDGLPIFTSDKQKLRIITNFKQEWHDLGIHHAHADLRETGSQQEWRDILLSIGIDPTLFAYQIQMNRHEGGAEELFKFTETEAFVDFFLKLALDPQPGMSVMENISTFRNDLLNRTQQWEPEQTLIQEVTARLQPLQGKYIRRQELTQHIIETRSKLSTLTTYINQKIEDGQQFAEAAQQQLSNATQKHTEFCSLADQQSRRALFWRREAKRNALEHLRVEQKRQEKWVNECQHAVNTWDAAQPFYKLWKDQQEVALLQRQITQNQTELEPLRVNLHQAASTYAAALQDKLTDLQMQDQHQEHREHEERQRVKTLHQQAVEATAQKARYETQVQHITEMLERYHAIHAQLMAEQVILPQESWSTASQRLTNEVVQMIREQQSLEQRIDTLESVIETTQISKSRVEHEIAEAEGSEYTARKQLAEISSEQRTLEQHPILIRYLESEQIDLNSLDEGAIRQLRKVERRLEEETLRIWMRVAERDRAIESLETIGYLPPDPAVETIMKLLDEHQIVTWTGWHYIRNNLGNLTKIHTFIKQLPAFAAGIVVRDDHFDLVPTLIQANHLQIDHPVTLVPQRAVFQEGVRDTFVVGPTNEAYFNPEVGQQLISEYKHDHENDQYLLGDFQHERIELHDVIARMTSFLAKYPAAWVVQFEMTIKAYAQQQQEGHDEIQRLEAQQQQQQQQRSQLIHDRSTVADNISTQQKRQIRLEMAIQQHPEDSLQLETRLRQLRTNAVQAQITYEQSNQAAAEALRNAENAVQRRRELAGELQMIRHLRSQIPEVRDQLVAISGDWKQLKKEYEHHRDRYEQRVNRDELSGMLKRVQQDVNEGQAIFSKKCQQSSLQQVAVEKVLTAIRDTDELSEHLQRAIKTLGDSQHAVKDTSTVIERTENELHSLEQQCIDCHIDEYDKLEDDSSDNAETLVSMAEQAHNEYEVLAAQQKDFAREAEIIIQATDHQLQSLRRYAESLEKLEARSLNLQVRLLPSEIYDLMPDPDWTPPTDDNIDREINALEEIIQVTQADCDELDQTRTKTAGTIRQRINQEAFDTLQGHLLRELRSYNDEDYERNCDYLLNQLMLRQQTVEALLASIEPHEQQIIDEMLSVAKRGIALLKSLTSRSRLPPTLPSFAERSFLKVSIENDVTDQRARIARLIDEIVKNRRMPSGIELVQQAVRCLCDSIKIEILFPDAQARKPYDDIPKLARRSGGERLTCSVMLYCTLARLRAHELGQTTGSSPLLLDNPIGTASYPEFLTLQREVARAMGIQLIYTTAVNDYEAIKILPNIERLCNERFDVATGEQIIERDDTDLHDESYLRNARLFIASSEQYEDRDDPQ